MPRLALPVALCLLAMRPDAVMGEYFTDMRTCATLFKARAEWMRSTGRAAETIGMMERYSRILSDEAWARDIDSAMWQRSPMPPDHEAILDLLTRWAEAGHGEIGLPLCMEDAGCIRCTGLLKEVLD